MLIRFFSEERHLFSNQQQRKHNCNKLPFSWESRAAVWRKSLVRKWRFFKAPHTPLAQVYRSAAEYCCSCWPEQEHNSARLFSFYINFSLNRQSIVFPQQPLVNLFRGKFRIARIIRGQPNKSSSTRDENTENLSHCAETAALSVFVFSWKQIKSFQIPQRQRTNSFFSIPSFITFRMARTSKLIIFQSITFRLPPNDHFLQTQCIIKRSNLERSHFFSTLIFAFGLKLMARN